MLPFLESSRKLSTIDFSVRSRFDYANLDYDQINIATKKRQFDRQSRDVTVKTDDELSIITHNLINQLTRPDPSKTDDQTDELILPSKEYSSVVRNSQTDGRTHS